MASKKELAELAAKLGDQLGETVATEGLNHAALTALVLELEAKVAKAAGTAPTGADGPAGDEGAVPGADGTFGDPEDPDAPQAAQSPAGGPPEPSPSAPSQEPLVSPPAKPRTSRYFLAGENSIFSASRGSLSGGVEVRADDFSTGQERILDLLKAGFLVERFDD